MKSVVLKVGVVAAESSWYVADLNRAASLIGNIEIVPLAFETLGCDLRSGAIVGLDRRTEARIDLRSLDAVLLRTMPPASLERVVFRMDLLASLQQHGILVVNPPKAIECAVDKFLTSHQLVAAGLPTPPTAVAQDADHAMELFQELGSDVVLKPLFGGEGRGITRLTDEDFAFRAFRWLERQGDVIYLQKFVPHQGFDVRVFIIDGKCLGMKRINNLDWRTNVSRGASTEAIELSDTYEELALHAHQTVGTFVSGVDLLPGLDGEVYVLEVNAVPGWQRLSQTLNVDIAERLLKAITSRIVSK